MLRFLSVFLAKGGEMAKEVVLSAEQEDALNLAARWFRYAYPAQPVFRLFGYAGTGKSTVTAALVNRLGLYKTDIMYAAPTGKAAQVMSSNGCPATTVHKAFYKLISSPEDYWSELASEREDLLVRIRLFPNDASAGRWQTRVAGIDEELGAPIENNMDFKFLGMRGVSQSTRLLVIDEASMLNDEQFADLRGLGLPVVLIGDPGQLPPVKHEGDITDAMQYPDVVLSEIHRQEGDSSILDIATLARNGDYIDYGNDGRGVSVRNGRNAGKLHLALRKARISLDDLVSFDQIICGKNATRHAINALVKEHLALDGDMPSGAVREKLIVSQNYDKDDVSIANGSMVTVEPTGEKGTIKVGGGEPIDIPVKITSIDGNPHNIDGHSLWRTPFEDELGEDYDRRRREAKWAKATIQAEWGWAITVNKAQGSQWNKVLLFDESYIARDKRKEWMYTAVTRAAKELTIVRI